MNTTRQITATTEQGEPVPVSVTNEDSHVTITVERNSRPLPEIREALTRIEGQLNECFLERQDTIRVFMVALLASQHVVVIGPPGTGKSLLTREVTARIGGLSIFSILMTAFTQLEEVVGPVDVPALLQSQFKRNLTGRAGDVEVINADEFYRGNSAVINTWLKLVNERKVDRGDKEVDAPLRSLYGSANTIPDDPELEAINDRVLFKPLVGYLTDDNFETLMMREAGIEANPFIIQQRETITREELQLVSKAVACMPFDRDAIAQFRAIRQELFTRKIYMSERRGVLCLRALQAYAYLMGSDKVYAEHLEVLTDALWQDPGQRTDVIRLVGEKANPALGQAMTLRDEAIDAYNTAMQELAEKERQAQGKSVSKADVWMIAANATAQMQPIHDELAQMVQTQASKGKGTSRLEQLRQEVEAKFTDLVRKSGMTLKL